MGYSFGIFLAFLAAYLFFRLWSVLGSRSGYERSEEEAGPSSWDSQSFEEQAETESKVIPFKGGESKQKAPLKRLKTDLSAELKDQLNRLQKMDSSFNIDRFLEGACIAFKMIVEAFASHNRDVLEQLLSPSVYKKFQSTLKKREQAQQTISIEVTEILSTTIEKIDVKEEEASIRVKFLSEQITVKANADGEIIDNPDRKAAQKTDVWTFEKSFDSLSSVWLLKETQTA